MSKEPKKKGGDSKVDTKSSEEIINLRRRLSLWGDNLDIDGIEETDSPDTDHDQKSNTKTIERGEECYIETYIGNSKQGYNPANLLKKKNQDSYITEQHPPTNSFLFGVFDGHGVKGDEVSQYVASKIPQILFNLPSFKTDVLSALSTTISQVVSLLNETLIDTQLSGTTLCMTVIRGNHAYIANIGDSRMMCINKSKNDEHLSLNILTHDHKPTDIEEKKRIESAGGKVETTTYEDGFSVTRVWMQKVRAPGLAMSRSIGDKIAHSIGVTDIPDLQDVIITNNMKYLLLSSDGLFEFVTDDLISSVIEENSNPNTCLDSLFNLASNTWLEIEGVIDDITIILIKIVDF